MELNRTVCSIASEMIHHVRIFVLIANVNKKKYQDLQWKYVFDATKHSLEIINEYSVI